MKNHDTASSRLVTLRKSDKQRYKQFVKCTGLDRCTSMLQSGLILGTLYVLSGCATVPTDTASTEAITAIEQTGEQTTNPMPKQLTTQKDEQKPDETARSFEPETLFDLIIAEMAGKQNRLDVTLGNYLKQAHRTQSPKITQRAAQIAKYMNAHQATLDATQLWLELEPGNIEALQLLTVQLIRASRFVEALEYIDQLLAQDAPANFDFLVQHSEETTRRKRQEIIDSLETIVKKYPKDTQLLFTKALLENQNGNTAAAYQTTELTLDIDPKYVLAIIFKAQLLYKDNKQEQATKLLQHAVKKHPDHKRLGIVYSRTLIEQGQFKEAQKQFQLLVDRFPDDHDLLLSLALISWESDLADQAKAYLTQLVELNHRKDEAYSYLAQIAQAQNDTEQAISYYQKIGLGPQFPNAQNQIAMLYAQSENLPKAREILSAARNLQPQQAVTYYIAEANLLSDYGSKSQSETFFNQALAEFPANTNILYSRAMFYAAHDNVEAMETDLREILADNPTSALALNALGYTLADKTDRLDESLELIKKAIALKPDDPAILDSMGWVHFKKGDIDTALQYLQRAYAQLQDHEIAAHLGEALWVSGKKSEAIRIWKEALEANPKSKMIRETMGRLNP